MNMQRQLTDAEATGYREGLARYLLVRMVRVLIATLLSCFTFWMIVRGSKGQSNGRVGSDGMLLDSNERSTGEIPKMINLELGPSVSFVFFAILLVIVGGMIASRASTFERADRVLRSVVVLIIGLTLVAVFTAYASFERINIREDMANGETIPVPFGNVLVTVEEDIPQLSGNSGD